MSKTNDYREAATMAIVMLTVAFEHKDKGQRDDMIRAAAHLFWHAARADAFKFVKDNFRQTMKDSPHPEEVIAVASAALANIAKVQAAAERCGVLVDLLKKERANVQA